jgi:hypothetical protein
VTKGELPGWRGKPPSQAPTMYAAGNTVVTTDANGVATIPLNRTFPIGPTVTANGGNGENVTIVSLGTTSFAALFYLQSGSLKTNSAVRCIWQALPST